jgi:hypothetical protein
MSAIAATPEPPPGRSRLAALLEHFARIQNPRDVRRILHPLGEVLLLMDCGLLAPLARTTIGLPIKFLVKR